MNGKPAEKMQLVDKQKTAKVNKKVNKKFQKQDDWGFVPSFYIDGLKMVWNIALIPVVLVAAVLEGVRAGFIAGMQKALTMYRAG